MPSWSPDGKTVYFVREVDGIGHWPAGGVVRDYQMTIPNVMKVAADGSGDPVQVIGGKVSKNGYTWQSWIREPVLSPDGQTLAMVSDRPDPSNSDVVLQFYDTTTKKSTVPKLTEIAPLGHQDPAWRPDGKVLLYVRNARDGPKGAPAIWRWDVAKGKASRADRARLPRAQLLPGRPLRRRDQDQLLRQRPRHPRRVERPRAAAADRTTAHRGLPSGRRSATRSRSCISRARSSTSSWSGSTAPRRTGRSRTSSP